MRGRHNKMYGNEASEDATRWLREQLRKEDGELKEFVISLSFIKIDNFFQIPTNFPKWLRNDV